MFSEGKPPGGHVGDKTASCQRQLHELERVDPAEAKACKKCVMKSERWRDAWDCWVLDHLSSKQPEKIAELIRCGGAWSTGQDKCFEVCGPDNESCRDACNTTHEKCVTNCQFN